MRQFVWLVLLLVVTPTSAQPGAWVGKSIITKRQGIKINRIDEKGGEVDAGDLDDDIEYRVLADKGKKIKVVTGKGTEGWFDKKDAVLLEDAAAHFTDAIKRNPNDPGGYQKRAHVQVQKNELNSAIKDISDAISLQPFDMAGWNSRGLVRIAQKKYDLAITDFSLAIRINPFLPAAYCNRAHAWSAKKEYQKAITDYTKAILLEPKMAHAHSQRGFVRFLNKEYTEALRDFKVAQKLQPNNGHVYKNRAWLFASSADAEYRDGKQALEQAKKALVLERNPAGDFYEVLAAAYAELGDFMEAIRWQEQALQDPRYENDKGAKQRLDLYRKKTPYRQE